MFPAMMARGVAWWRWGWRAGPPLRQDYAQRRGGGEGEARQKERGRIAPPPSGFSRLVPLAQAPAALLNWRYFSLPTKPNFETPEPLMMLSTFTERS